MGQDTDGGGGHTAKSSIPNPRPRGFPKGSWNTSEPGSEGKEGEEDLTMKESVTGSEQVVAGWGQKVSQCKRPKEQGAEAGPGRGQEVKVRVQTGLLFLGQ